MKHINYIFAFLLALFCGTGLARADAFTDYKMDFNTSISTSAHDFKVASGWGHVVDYYQDDDDWGYGDTYYVDYTYGSSTGRDGSGALKVGGQKFYGTDVYDLLVTPKVTGTSSIYVKQSSSNGTISFYTVTKSGSTYKRSTKIDVELPALSTTEWTKVEIPAQEGTYIGIRASYVYIDDFEAAQAEYDLLKTLTVSSVINKGASEPDCTADGKFPINYSVTVKNTGDVALTAGMDNYSISLINYKDSTAYYTMPLTASLAVGATETVQLQTELDYASHSERLRYDVMENLTRTTKSGLWIEPVAYAPKLQMRDSKGVMDDGATYNFGMISKPVSMQFTIRNTGAAPLKVTAIELPTPFTTDATVPVTIDAHKDVNFNITLPVDVPGIYTGDVTVKGEGVADYKFGVSGTVRDSKKFFADFEDQEVPAGAVLGENWSISQRDYASNGNAYMATNNRRGGDTKFITPLLKVAEGEKMTFDAARTSYTTTGDDVYLNVYYSTDRVNWTLAKNIPGSELSGLRDNYNYNMGKLTTYVLDNIPAGNYYIGFGAGFTSVDNIYGFEKVEVAHDILVSKTDMPSAATVNYPCNATVTLKNIASKAEEAGSYTMSLYAGDKVVATAEAAIFQAGKDTAFSFSFVPHTAGTVKLYAQFKSTADGYTISTLPVDVTVAAETATLQKVIGEGNTSRGNAVFYWMYADNEKGGDADFYYPADMLQTFGLQSGDKISSISFVGKPTSSKAVTNVDMTVALGWIDGSKYAPGENVDALTKYELEKGKDFDFKVNEPVETKINLTEPLVWDGTSALRFNTYVNSLDGKWISVSYDADKNYLTGYTKSGSVSSFGSAGYAPVMTLGIQLEPSTISGTVKCGEKAVADATLTLKSDDDVIYSGKSDETGAYSFPVIQTSKTYTLTVSADGYHDYVEKNVTLGESIVKNITLKKIAVSVSGSVTYRKVGLAGATVTLTTGSEPALTATTAADGNYAFAEVAPGKNYMLKVTADKFTDYTSADSILIAADTTFSAVEMTKAPVAVSGMVLFRNAALKDVTVTLSHGETTLTATTGEDGTYKFDAVAPDCNYALTAKAAKFNDYAAADSVAVLAATELDDIVMTKPNFKIYGQLKWGNTPVSGVIAQITWVSSTGDNMKWGDFTKADGKFEFSNLDANCVYTLNVIDLNKEFEDQPEVATIESGEDTEENVSLVIKPVSVTVPASGYVAYSYKRGLDFSGATGLTAYAVSDVVKNYTVLSEVSEAPANTGLILKATPGTYEVTPVETSAPLSENKLVAVQGADVTIGSDNVGKIWAMTETGGLTVFKSEQGTTISKGGAYLSVESTEPVIYLSQTDGISSVDGSNGGMLDETKPMYNLAGQKVGKNYKGVVIQNGRKYNK